MSSDARESRLDTRSTPALFLFVALGLFLVGYGGAGISANDHQVIREVLQWFQVAAGVTFLIAAVLGVSKRLQSRRR